MVDNYLASFPDRFLLALQVATSTTVQSNGYFSELEGETHLLRPPSAGLGAGGWKESSDHSGKCSRHPCSLYNICSGLGEQVQLSHALKSAHRQHSMDRELCHKTSFKLPQVQAGV